jgi:(p)ppGpp synthase/HD superfamily hydrolase
MHKLKTELEDSCFRYLRPEKYNMLDEQVRGSESERKRYEEEVVHLLVRQMEDAGLGCDNSTLLVTGRTKGLYSIYSKMKRNDIEFDDVHDVTAFRIIVDDVESCYRALGVVHSHFKPCPGKIKDYIAVSLFNLG